MIASLTIAVLLVIVGVLWVRVRFWKWTAKMRLGVIDTQRKTIEGYAETKRKEATYNQVYSEIEWPKFIEEKP